MVSQHVVKLIIDYLDEREATVTSATLVGIFWYVDGRNKTPPLLEEINLALGLRPNVGIEHNNGDIVLVFGHTRINSAVTPDDYRRADAAYRKEFSLKLKELKSKRPEKIESIQASNESKRSEI